MPRDDEDTDALIAAAQWLYQHTKNNPWLYWFIPSRVLNSFNSAAQAFQEASK